MGGTRADAARLALATTVLLVGCGEATETVEAPVESRSSTQPTQDASPERPDHGTATAPASAPPGCTDPFLATDPLDASTGIAAALPDGPDPFTGFWYMADVPDGDTPAGEELPWKFVHRGAPARAWETLDLDADGTHEVMVEVEGRPSDTSSTERFWIVSGATDTGTRDPSAVGISAGAVPMATTDMDRDGTPEIVVLSWTPSTPEAGGNGTPEVTGTLSTIVYDAAEVMALEPPASLAEVAPTIQLPGMILGTLDLRGEGPVYLSHVASSATLFMIRGDATVRLSTASIQFAAPRSYFQDVETRQTDTSLLVRDSQQYEWEIPLECLGA